MKYICLDCDAILEEDEIATWYEPRGEFWGMPCSERMTGCPHCFGTALEEYHEREDDDEDDED